MEIAKFANGQSVNIIDSVVPYTEQVNSYYRFSGRLYNCVFNICGPDNLYNELVDADGNTWTFSISSNYKTLNISVLSSELITILSGSWKLYADNVTPQFRSEDRYCCFMFFTTDGSSIYVSGYVTSAFYGGSPGYELLVSGIEGVTTARMPGTGIPSSNFPNRGAWPIGTSLQDCVTLMYSFTTLRYNRYVVNCLTSSFGSDVLYVAERSDTTYSFPVRLTITATAISLYFSNTFGLNSISNYTAYLDKYNWRYTGEFITPTLTIKTPEEIILVENVDYTKTYTNNLNVGTANVLAVGIGNYSGTKSINFYIIGNDLESNTNCLLNKYVWVYTGDFITPEVQVWDTLDEVRLVEGVDYQKTYTNNLNVGTAFVTIVGINNWSGSINVDFKIISNDDPYDPGGTTEPGGGGGDFDDESEPVPVPIPPGLTVVDSGLITVYVPTLAQLQAVGNFLWSNDISSVIYQLFQNPMDAIFGLSMIPFNVPYDVLSFRIGNITLERSLPINHAVTNFVQHYCGSVTVTEFWGSYLDYNPYTKIEIYLPFIGFRSLDPDIVMNKTLKVYYNADILSGACTALIYVGDAVLYQFDGNCLTQLPISTLSWTNSIMSAVTAAASIGSIVSTGGLSSPFQAATLASAITNTIKPEIQKSGSMSGSPGFLGVKKPYLVISRPKQAVAQRQNAFEGYPSFITVRLDQLTGFTKVWKIHLNSIPATKDELDELHAILTEGFIIQ